MNIRKVYGLFFSPTGNTETVVKTCTNQTGKELNVTIEYVDFTSPQQRNMEYSFSSDDFVIIGIPVYAGRIPNKLLPFIQTKLKGNKTLVMPVVTYGNRSFDNALKELSNELTAHGFYSIAALAVPCEHAFSSRIATNRPNKDDLKCLESFVEEVVMKLKTSKNLPASLSIPGDDIIDAYYTPLGIDGKPAKFLKAKPKTKVESCTSCGICTNNCPMGAISFDNFIDVPGTCIKCQACIKKCPTHAKYFDDEAFLSHVKMLEQNYKRRLDIQCFY